MEGSYWIISTILANQNFTPSYADPEIFVRGVPTLTTFFSLMGGGGIQLPLKAGHHRRADDGPKLNAGSVAS